MRLNMGLKETTETPTEYTLLLVKCNSQRAINFSRRAHFFNLDLFFDPDITLRFYTKTTVFFIQILSNPRRVL